MGELPWIVGNGSRIARWALLSTMALAGCNKNDEAKSASEDAGADGGDKMGAPTPSSRKRWPLLQ